MFEILMQSSKYNQISKFDSSGNDQYSEALMKKINSISNQQTYFSMQNSGINQGSSSMVTSKSICYYKMLKCESKLIRFIMELNGLQNTDRHDWNVLWTHTQGKNYFYERLNPTQKINHFPASQELTRKDRLAINIKRMQDRYTKTYFNFIPETFVLPD